jgi:hypothetical protein
MFEDVLDLQSLPVNESEYDASAMYSGDGVAIGQ